MQNLKSLKQYLEHEDPLEMYPIAINTRGIIGLRKGFTL